MLPNLSKASSQAKLLGGEGCEPKDMPKKDKCL